MNIETEQTTEAMNDAPAWTDVAAASEAKELADKFAPTPVVHLISVPLTDKEQAAKAIELAAVTQEIEVAEAHLKETAAGLREEIKAMKGKQKVIAEEIREGRGQVEVQCTRRVIFETNTVQIVRDDTGEVLDERALTADERQMGLFDDTTGAHAGDAAPEDVLSAARDMADDDEPSLDDDILIDDPESVLEGAAEEEAPKRKGRKSS